MERTGLFVLDAAMAFGVKLVQLYAGPGAAGGGVRLHRHGDEAELEKAFPLRARGHDDPFTRTVTSL